MFYFKDAPVSPSKLDPEQLEHISRFQESLGNEEGGLYWRFNSLDDFERLLRLHITRQVQEFCRGLKSQNIDESDLNLGEEESVINENENDAEDEIGLLDLVEITEDRFQEIQDIAKHFTQYTTELAEQINTRTEEIDELRIRSEGEISRKELRRLVERFAGDMDQYVSRMEAELPLFGKNLNEGIDALVRVAKLSIEFDATESEQDQAREGIDIIVSLRDTLDQLEPSIQDFQESITSLPRLTSVLNKSKREVSLLLERLLYDIRTGQSLMREAELMIKSFLDDE